MAIKDISDVELAKTLAEVGKELESLLKAETERLAKSATGPESTPPAEETAAAAGGPPSNEAPPEDAGGGAPVDGEGGPPVDAAPDGQPQPGAEGGEGQGPDFSQLSDEELKQAYLHIKQEIMQRMQAAQGAGGGQPQGGPPPAPPDAGVAKNSQEIVNLRKALEEQKKLVQSQQKQIELTATVLSKALNRPQRKAVTDATDLAKSEPVRDVKKLSKKEVQSLLKPMVEGNSLSKSDREAVNAYCFGYSGFEAIEHLFKK